MKEQSDQGLHSVIPLLPFTPLIKIMLRGSGPEVVRLFSCSTQVSMKFILLINVKMPTVVGILTFISRINTTSESFKQDKICILQYFTFYKVKFSCSGQIKK